MSSTSISNFFNGSSYSEPFLIQLRFITNHEDFDPKKSYFQRAGLDPISRIVSSRRIVLDTGRSIEKNRENIQSIGGKTRSITGRVLSIYIKEGKANFFIFRIFLTYCFLLDLAYSKMIQCWTHWMKLH